MKHVLSFSMLYVIRGLPGSGKTTFAEHLVSAGLIKRYWEADQFFVVDGVYRFDPKRLGDAHNWCKAQVEADLDAGVDVAVSNTFVRHWEFQPYVDMADCRGVIRFVVAMHGGYGSVHDVPEEVLCRMRRNWEV